MEQDPTRKDICTSKVSPGQKIEVTWFERDRTCSGIGVVQKVTPTAVKVILKNVLSGGSTYKVGQEVKIKRVPESTGRASLNNIRLIEENPFRHKDFL